MKEIKDATVTAVMLINSNISTNAWRQIDFVKN